jgi:gliding motility-associated-like protein
MRDFLIILFFLPSLVFGQETIRYVENIGQFNEKCLYKADLGDGNAFFGANTVRFNFYDSKKVNELHGYSSKESKIDFFSYDLSFINSNYSSNIIAENSFDEYYNFLLGSDKSKWKNHVKAFKSIKYSEIYSGVDCKFYSNDIFLKYDFIVSPNSDPNIIKLNYSGVNIRLHEESILIDLGFKEIYESRPYAYQLINNNKVEVKCNYVITSNNNVSFEFPNGYNKAYELIIDPVLITATLSGSMASDTWGHSATYDTKGNIYTGARCFSSGYPTTTGAYQINYGGGTNDIAISKLDSSGSSLLWATYLGGSGDDFPHSLIVNSKNELCVYGSSTSSNYPTTTSAFDNSYNGASDIIVSHLDSLGANLLGSSYFGGSSDDGLNMIVNNYGDEFRGEIMVDNYDNIFIASFSSSTDFPTTSGVFQSSLSGSQDGVVLKLNSTLSSIIWSTYIGSSGSDAAYGIRVDNNFVYITGTAANGFPVTSGSAITTFQGSSHDGFVAKLNNLGTVLDASSFFGSSSNDQSFFIDLDKDSSIYIFGQNGASISISPGCYGVANSKQFVAKFSNDLSNINWQTSIGSGSSSFDFVPTAFLVDVCRNIYISGHGGLNYIPSLYTTSNALYTSGSFYLMQLSPDAANVDYATHFTGNHVDGGTSRFDPAGRVYQAVCSCPSISGSGMMTTSNAYSSSHYGNCDIGVFKFDFETAPALAIASASPASGTAPLTIAFTNSGNGTSFYWDFDDNGATSTLRDPIHTFANAGTYYVQLIAVDSSTCNIADTLILPVIVTSPPCSISLIDSVNVSCFGGYDGFIEVQGSGSSGFFYYSLQVFSPILNSWTEIANSPLSGSYTSYPVTFASLNSDSFLVVMTDSLGCVDTLETFLTQPQQITSTESITSCDDYSWLGNVYDSTGVYLDTLTSNNGCDSILTLNLTINDLSTILIDTSCGQYLYNGILYDSSGVYYDTLVSVDGCDSIIQLEITVFQDSSVTFITACDSAEWNGVWYYNDTIVTDTSLITVNNFSNSNGANVQNLVLNSGFETAINGLPGGDPISAYPNFLNNWTAVNTDGEFIFDSLLASSGFGFLSVLQNANANPSLPWLGSGNTFGGFDRVAQIINVIPSQNYKLEFKCRSGDGSRYGYGPGNLIVEIEETLPTNSLITSQVITPTLNWQSFDINFVTGVNTAEIILLFSSQGSSNTDNWIDDINFQLNSNIVGCDSVATAIITINTSTFDTTSIIATDNYLWPIDGVNYMSSGVYVNISSDSLGCNVTQVLDLTINISGCTDSIAINYNPLASVDDGSCIDPCNIDLLDSSNISCFGFNDGFIEVFGTGVNNNFNYQLQLYDSLFMTWITVGQSPLGGIYTQTPVLFSNLYTGCYRVIMTDSLYCNDTTSICLTQPDQITAIDSISNATSFTNNNGSIVLNTVSGGTSPYSFNWSGPNGFSSTNQDIFNLESGFYSLTILDDSLCSNNFIYFVDLLIAGCTDPTANNFDPIATVDDSSCCFLNFYDENITICIGDSIELLYSGSTNNVDSYLWSTGDTISSIFVSPSVNTSYWFTQTINGFSCSDTINVFVSCLEFTPTVSVALSNLNCGLTDLIISVSQDSNEVDMDSATFLSDAGSFTISSMNLGDNIGTASMGFGNSNLTTNLIVASILPPNQIVVEAINQSNGLVLGTFIITNLTNGGVEIIALSPGDGNSYTNGNYSTINFINVFDSPDNGFLNFSSSITSELGDVDIQYFPFILNCTDFSPNVIVSLSDLNCGVIADLTITVSQDTFEVDMDTAIFVSDGGYFNLTSLNVGDTIGSASMDLTPITYNADLIVDSVVSSTQIIVEAVDQLTGLVLGTFTISNLVGGGIEIIAVSPNDGNNYTLYGNVSTVTFDSIFVNSSSGLLTFTSNITSELGDFYTQSSSFSIGTISSFFTVFRCETYTWNGNVFDSTGIYVDTLTSIIGCDSIVTLNLTIYNNSVSYDTIGVCYGINWNGTYLDSNGTYIDTISNYYGCDSIVNLFLTIDNNSSFNIINACDNYLFNGTVYDSSGIYTDTLINSFSCDSIVTIDLTINYSSSYLINDTACGFLIWDGIVYDTTGIYSNLYSDIFGCDSLVTIDLVVNNITSVYDTITVCDTLFWNGNIYTVSGNYIDTVIGNSGCDSIVNLNLTINNSTSSSNIITACDNYFWLGQTFTTSGVYDTVLSNVIGCDSFTQIYLTIIQPIITTVNIHSCGPYLLNGNIYDSTGVYYDTLSAVTGCDSIIELDLIVTPVIEISSLITNVDCYDSSSGYIDISIVNGTFPFVYQWSNGAITQDINNLLGDSTYSLSIVDSAGCTFDTSFYISQPTQISVVANVIDVNCYAGNDGSINLNIFGGTGLYSVDWGSTDTSNLFTGSYTYVVNDANGCIYIDSAEVNQPNSIEIDVSTLNISCFAYSDGFIEVSVLPGSGVPAYTYDWVGPNLFSSNISNIYNLFAGDYNLTITDANNCQFDTIITLTEPANLPQTTNIQISNYSGFNIRCKGDNSGWVSVDVSGGYEPYSYLWSNFSTSDSIYDLNAGLYTLELTDSLGCVIVFDFPIIEPAEPLSSNIIATTDYNGYNISCYGFNDGALLGLANGGVPNYSYYWNTVKLTDSITDLYSGNYELIVYDNNNCESISNITITQPDSLYMEITSFTDTCSKGVGRSEVVVSGGVNPYSYLWSNGLTSSIISNFSEGTYDVLVQDANLCEISGSANIFNLPSPIIDFTINPDNQRLFDQLDDPIVFIDQTDGLWQSIDSWTWNFADGSFGSDSISFHSYSDTGTYIIVLTTVSEYNCIDTLSKKLIITDYNLYIPNAFTPFSTNDQLNEVFKAYGFGVSLYKMEIYSRWGERIFTSDSLDYGWDGTTENGEQVPVGIYIYYIETKNIYGEDYKYSGQVKLIR